MAPGVDPVQGASRKWMPLALSFSPMPRLAVGEMVLASATTVPGLAPSMTPFGPVNTSSDMRVSPTQAKTKSACSATCLGVCASDRFFLRGELLRFARGVRPDRHLMTGARQIPRHRITHETQSKKSKLCHTKHGSNEA